MRNPYEVHGSVAYLFDGKGNRIIIDAEDLPKVENFRWYCRKGSHGYVVGSADEKKIYLHRHIMGVTEFSDKVDHINHDAKDNRKANLRVCSNRQNSMNRAKQHSEGVSYRKDKKKWRAYINVNYKQISLGLFATKREALKVRKEAVQKYYGDYRFQGKKVV